MNAEIIAYAVITAIVLFIAAQSRFTATLVTVVAALGFTGLIIAVVGPVALLAIIGGFGLAGFGLVLLAPGKEINKRTTNGAWILYHDKWYNSDGEYMGRAK